MGIHILLADARHIYRSGLRTIFSSDPDVTSITEAISGKDLINKLASRPFDFVIAHQSLITPISILPKGQFALLTSEPDKETLIAACNHDVRGYFSENPPEDLLRAMLSLPPGQCLLDPALTLWALKHISDNSLPSLNLETLTAREQEIFVLQQSGLSYAEIADKLSIARSTVKRHIANITSKLELKRDARETLALRDAQYSNNRHFAHNSYQK